MTHQSSGYPASAGPYDERSTKDVAREQASEVGRTTGAAGQRVANTAAEQAGQVGREARRQARDLLGQARGQVTEQARNGQQQASDGLRSLAKELHGMADGGEQQGPASDLAKQAADKLGELADWLGRREPGDLVEEVRALARRRPGAFLLGAAAAGVLAGRLTRGAVDANRDTDSHDLARRNTSDPVSAVAYPPTPMDPPGYPAVPPPSGYPTAPPPTGSAGEPGWLPPEPAYQPPHGSAVPSPSRYPASDPGGPASLDDPLVSPRPGSPAGAVPPADLGPAEPRTPPSGSRSVGEYVEDLRQEGRPEAGGPR
jgi:hypothetical protein